VKFLKLTLKDGPDLYIRGDQVAAVKQVDGAYSTPSYSVITLNSGAEFRVRECAGNVISAIRALVETT